ARQLPDSRQGDIQLLRSGRLWEPPHHAANTRAPTKKIAFYSAGYRFFDKRCLFVADTAM
ncbi:hypothetical protein, partial [Pseudomonas syringae]|uniref:hypothetical protein n=1 Tax=Pseudomonas syringae TaxID=317 RepID=UPI001CA54329